MLFGKGRREIGVRPSGTTPGLLQPEMYVVAYEKMLKGNKLARRGKPIRQVAVVVNGTVRLVTSGDSVDRKTYEALVLGGVLPAEGTVTPPELIEAEEPQGVDLTDK